MNQQQTELMRSGNHTMLNINQLVPYPEHPFKLYTGQRLDDMVMSIKEYGIIVPVIVRFIERSNGKFEILSGHNRVNAAKLAGHERIPVIVNNRLTDSQALLIVTETNLSQRSFADLSHSERAIALAQHYNATKCQGRRNDLLEEIDAYLNPCGSSAEIQQKSDSREKIGRNYGLSRDKVAKYIRLSRLSRSLLEHIDNCKITFNAGYQLSFIEDKAIQESINIMIVNGYDVSTKKAVLLRKCYEEGNLTPISVEPILYQENADERKPFKLSKKVIDSYFGAEQSNNEIEEIIVTALQFYYDSFQEQEEEI